MNRRYRPGDGFGEGFEVTPAGYVHRFPAPVTKVVVKNASPGGVGVYVGMNEVITDADGNSPPEGALGVSKEAHEISSISAAQAIAKGVFVDAGENQTFQIQPLEGGRRSLYCLWFITAADEPAAGRIIGGVIGI
ncbi:MAG: hypothetical protein WC992_02235 [Acholeplasmataceae bacterium]